MFYIMKTATGKGRLAHKFHGNYWCIIAISFESAELAALALAVINAAIKTAFEALGVAPVDDKGEEIKAPDAWKAGANSPLAIVWVGYGNQLDIVKRVFIDMWGCKQPIDDTNHSIDYGDEFTLAVPYEEPRIEPGKKGEQLSLF